MISNHSTGSAVREQSNGIGPSETKRVFSAAELQPHMHCPFGGKRLPPDTTGCPAAAQGYWTEVAACFYEEIRDRPVDRGVQGPRCSHIGRAEQVRNDIGGREAPQARFPTSGDRTANRVLGAHQERSGQWSRIN